MSLNNENGFLMSPDQAEAYQKAITGKNIFLTGKAGTGKTTVIKKVITDLQEDGRRVAVIAPTGIAAQNLKGQTMHSFFMLRPYGVLAYSDCRYAKNDKSKMWKMLDTIVIDEVSMLRPDHLDAINWTLIKNGCGPLYNKQVVFVGDKKQLRPPINGSEKSKLFEIYEGQDFESAEIYEFLNLETVELTTIHRQSDPEFIENLNLIREGQKTTYFKQFVTNKTKGIILAPTNALADKYNRQGLASLNGKTLTSEAVINGDRVKPTDFNVEPTIYLKDGARIMYLKNDAPLVNGSLGTFRVKNDHWYIEVDDIAYELCKHEFEKWAYELEDNALKLVKVGSMEQYPVKLAYALTIHKSQGLTFDNITIDLSQGCFAPGQLYTALSRVRSPKGLNIIKK